MSESDPTPRRLVVAVIFAMVVVAGAVGAVATSSHNYALSIDGSVDVPATTYSAEGETIDVTSIGKAVSSDELTFSVDAPDGEYYTVRIANAEGTVVETTAGRGSETFSMPLRYYEVGTYAIAVTNESDNETEVYAAQPFVVEGYRVTHSVPSSVSQEETLRITVTVEARGSPPAFDSVTVAVGDSTSRVVTTASQVNDTTYVAEFDASQFTTGEYTVVSGVRGDIAFNGTAREYYGITTADRVLITDTATTTATQTATESSESTGAASTATATPTATPQPTTVANTTAKTKTPTLTQTPRTATSSPTATAATDAEPTATATETPSPMDGSTQSQPSPGDSTETTADFVHPLWAFLVVVGTMLLAVHRTN